MAATKGSELPVVTALTDVSAKLFVIENGVTSTITAPNLAADSSFTGVFGAVTQQHCWVDGIALRPPTGTGSGAAFGVLGNSLVPAFSLDGAGASEVLQYGFGVPDHWLTMAVDVHWANDGAGSGDVRFSTDHLCVAAGGDYSAARTTTTLTATAGAQNIKVVSTIVSSISLSTARAGLIRITRLSADAADTLTNDIAIVGLMLRRLT